MPNLNQGSREKRARPADRKRQLVDHAATLFLQRGYQQVSVADIARASGVTAPSVYRHFADKQALLAAAVLAGIDDLEACTDRALGDGSRALDDLIGEVTALGVARPEAASLWRWNSNNLTREQNKQVALRTREVLGRWGAAIARDRGDLTERDSRQLAWAVLSVTGSLSAHHTRMSTARARAELSELVIGLIALSPAQAPTLAVPIPLAPPTPTRRDEILDAAAQLFGERGYSAVGVDEIGTAVGITGPSVYKHFSSKLAILMGIGQRSALRLEAAAMAAATIAPEPDELLGRLVDSYVGQMTSTPDLAAAFNSSLILAGQDAATELLAAQRRYVSRWIDLANTIRPELRRDQATVAVHAALSIVNDAVRMRRGLDHPDFASRMAYFMKGVLGLN